VGRAPVDTNPRQGVRDPDGNDDQAQRRRQHAHQVADERKPCRDEHHREREHEVADTADRQAVGERDPEAVDAVYAPLQVEDDAKRPDQQVVVVHRLNPRSSATGR
jgi:hypothetical protein